MRMPIAVLYLFTFAFAFAFGIRHVHVRHSAFEIRAILVFVDNGSYGTLDS